MVIVVVIVEKIAESAGTISSASTSVGISYCIISNNNATPPSKWCALNIWVTPIELGRNDLTITNPKEDYEK